MTKLTRRVICQSSGTVSIRAAVSGTSTNSLFFVPDCDHYVKHKKEDYVAFVNTTDAELSLLYKYDKDGIPIDFKSSNPLLSNILAIASDKSSKVTIEVEIDVSVKTRGSSIQKLGPIEFKQLVAIDSPAK